LTASLAGAAAVPSPRRIVPALGVTQILAWGSSYYLLAVLAQPIAEDTGWSLTWIVAGLSLGLLTAGLVSPLVGRQIHRRGGRPVLAASAVLLGTGLLGLALAPNLPVFVGAWLFIGLGMGAGLYDPAFSTLGRLYGRAARHYITTLTLFGGLASTACWPLSAFLLSAFGWRGACATYAAIHLLFSLPVYLIAIADRKAPAWNAFEEGEADVAVRPAPARRRAVFGLLTTTIMIASMLSTVMSVHLLTMLQADGIALSAAVALGAMIGPAQVGARFVEMLVSRYHHPIWTKVASVSLVALGIGSLWVGIPIVGIALVFYGAGIGLESIARATLPLALFGAANYAPIMGRLAMPSLIAQAASPSLGALLIQWLCIHGALGAIAAVALGNVALALALLALAAPRRRSSGTESARSDGRCV
jgi:MFS family permease